MPIRFAIDRCLLGAEGFVLGLFFFDYCAQLRTGQLLFLVKVSSDI